MDKFKVLLADDHAIIRDALKLILADTEDFTAAGEAASGQEVMRQVRAADWGVLVLDISMPGSNGLDLIRMIKDQKPKLPILVLSIHSEEQYAVRALHAGASGYLTKESDSNMLVAAIRRVANGGVYISDKVAKMMVRGIQITNEPLPHSLLSDREYQIFNMLIAGRRPTEIASELDLSVKTVSAHKTHILQKMNLTNLSELIQYAISHQLSELSEF